MLRRSYSLQVRTIEEVRLKNFKTLVKEITEELGREPSGATIAGAFGISPVYVWQILTGKRTAIESKAARTIEATYEKETGWMDTDFDLWPFPDIEPPRLFNLKPEQRIEIQALVRDRIERFEAANAARSVKVSRKPPQAA